MSSPHAFGLARPRFRADDGARVEYALRQHTLRRILAFTRRSIDDVVNNPIAKREVLGYFKLHRWVERQSEVSELERAWNPLGQRT